MAPKRNKRIRNQRVLALGQEGLATSKCKSLIFAFNSPLACLSSLKLNEKGGAHLRDKWYDELFVVCLMFRSLVMIKRPADLLEPSTSLRILRPEVFSTSMRNDSFKLLVVMQ